MMKNKKLLIGILVVGIILISGWCIWSTQIENRCNSDYDCRFYCGCGCISKQNWICPIFGPRVLCEQYPCAVCRCLEGKCASWQDVFNEAQHNKNIDLCQEIRDTGCKNQCLSVLETLIKIKPQVTITTDKMEYEQGKNIIANANFIGKIQVFSEGAWSIYRWDGNLWNKVIESIGCSSFPDCEKINFDRIEDCNFPICEAPAWYEIDNSHPYARWMWDQKQAVGNKSYKCRWFAKEVFDHECIIHQQVPSGRYNIRFEYVLSTDKLFGGKEGKEINYIEREFTIK